MFSLNFPLTVMICGIIPSAGSQLSMQLSTRRFSGHLMFPSAAKLYGDAHRNHIRNLQSIVKKQTKKHSRLPKGLLQLDLSITIACVILTFFFDKKGLEILSSISNEIHFRTILYFTDAVSFTDALLFSNIQTRS